MTKTRLLPCIAIALTLGFGATPSESNGSATQKLIDFDKTTYSGRLEVRVDLYDPPKSPGQFGSPKRYPALLLFERPDRFRLALRPGAKDEYRAVAEGGIVRWLDLATGLSGKAETGKVTDPLALALLGSAGELLRFSASSDLKLPKNSKLSAARLQPGVWGSRFDGGYAWLGSDGRPAGFEFRFADGTRVFISVLKFEQNVKTSPGDFQL